MAKKKQKKDYFPIPAKYEEYPIRYLWYIYCVFNKDHAVYKLKNKNTVTYEEFYSDTSTLENLSFKTRNAIPVNNDYQFYNKCAFMKIWVDTIDIELRKNLSEYGIEPYNLESVNYKYLEKISSETNKPLSMKSFIKFFIFCHITRM